MTPMNELKLTFEKRGNYDEIKERFMKEMPGYINKDNPEILIIPFKKNGVEHVYVTTWIITNCEWCEKKLHEILEL